ncbi:MAG TPA: hypothetical protein VMG10_11705 [Gemmataceae bacterium]|nr:hypothetical protein [Gemmataceae bacterium]
MSFSSWLQSGKRPAPAHPNVPSPTGRLPAAPGVVGKPLPALLLGILISLAGTGASRGDPVTALIAEENGNLDRLNITTGMSTLIANNGSEYFGLAFNANESVLYGIIAPSFGELTSLVTINQTTGANTLVGANGVALTTITNLSNGQLFGVDFNDILYQINPNTGTATEVGPTGLPSLIGIGFDNSLASDGMTLYYTLDTNGGTGTLYTLNTTTGAAVAVGSTGTTGIAGSVFAGPTLATGNLYGFQTNGQTDLINLTTAQATVLNSNGISDIFGGVGIITELTAVPEPSSITLAVVGIVIFGGIRGNSCASSARKRQSC